MVHRRTAREMKLYRNRLARQKKRGKRENMQILRRTGTRERIRQFKRDNPDKCLPREWTQWLKKHPLSK